MTVAGCFFEELLHTWFKASPPPSPVKEVIQAKETGREGLEQPTSHLRYWIPNILGFGNIDAAFIAANRKLFCIQHKVLKIHKFNTI